MSLSDDPPIRCFLSYAQKDDVLALRFVRPFMESLQEYAIADRGRELEIFHDRDSINWGDLAQAKIRDSVRNAQVLLPIITRRYFDRPYCREELFRFHNQAVADGVPSLLLPVVLLGEDYLTETNADPAVRIIVERQQRKLKEMWLQGPDTEIWRRTVLGLVTELVRRVDDAESTLLHREPKPADGKAFTAAQEEFGDQAMRLVDVVSRVLDEFRTEEQDERLIPGSIELRDAGWDFERRTIGFDQVLRDNADAGGQLLDQTGFLTECVEEAEHLIRRLRPDESASVSMRKVMHAYRQGLVSIQSALRIASSWPELPKVGQ